MIHDTQSSQISQKQDERNLYAIMKTMCPPGYHHKGFVATHALGHMMYGYMMYIYIQFYNFSFIIIVTLQYKQSTKSLSYNFNFLNDYTKVKRNNVLSSN